MKWGLIYVSILTGILALLNCTSARAAGPMTLATGPAGDFFWIMGRELCQIWDGEGLPTEAVETSGDNENIDLIISGKADLALVSGLALADFLKQNPDAPIVTVASCWKSAVHVMLNGKLIKTNSVRDLEGAKLYLGPESAPNGNTARRILAALGIRPNRYVREVAASELLEVMTNFRNQELDGVIIIGPVPDPMVRDIAADTGGGTRLIPADDTTVSALSGAGLPLFLSKIPKESYPYQPDEMDVIAMGTYLISKSDLAGETARKLSAAIFQNAAKIAAYFPRGGTLSAEDAAAHLVAPLHPALR